MKFLLDTCIVSGIAKRLPRLTARIRGASPHELAIASITRLEIEYGLKINRDAETRVGKVLRDFCGSIESLPFDSHCAERGAEIRAALKRRGKPIGAFDLLIGATALQYGLILVTNNTREFERIDGLAIEDWTDAG